MYVKLRLSIPIKFSKLFLFFLRERNREQNKESRMKYTHIFGKNLNRKRIYSIARKASIYIIYI